MRNQFYCHWMGNMAESIQILLDLDEWRPYASMSRQYQTRCNP